MPLYQYPQPQTGSGNWVRATSPTLVTPILGVAAGTSLALGGATIGTDALAVTGTTKLGGLVTVTSNINLGGATSSFPQIQPSGNSILFTLADNSAYASIRVAAISFPFGTKLLDAANGTLNINNSGGSASLGISVPNNAVMQLGGFDTDLNSAIVAQTLRVQGALGGGTSNQAGKDFSIYGSPGKGTGAGGSLLFYTSPAGSTGTAQNAGVLALTIGPTGATTFAQTITTTGSLNASGNIIFGGALVFGSNSIIKSTVDGNATLLNQGQTGFTALQFGGTTSSFPALKRSTTSLQARLADDGAFTAIQGKLTTDNAYAAGVVVGTGSIVIYDSTGTAYRVPCLV